SVFDPATVGLFRRVSAGRKSAAGLCHSRRAGKCAAAGPIKSRNSVVPSPGMWEGGASLNSRRILAVRVSRLRINSRLLDRKILHITFLAEQTRVYAQAAHSHRKNS